MNGQLTSLTDFRFDSLRKFMQPLYAELNHHVLDTQEEKQAVLCSVIPRFFQRLRIYREVSLETIAQRAGRSVDDLKLFEEGVIRKNSKIEHAYCQACSGFMEQEFFGRRIDEFIHPTKRASQEIAAKEVLKRFGVVMPDVDYANLNSPKGTLLSFPPKR